MSEKIMLRIPITKELVDIQDALCDLWVCDKYSENCKGCKFEIENLKQQAQEQIDRLVKEAELRSKIEVYNSLINYIERKNVIGVSKYLLKEILSELELKQLKELKE